MARQLTARGEQRRAELMSFATERFAANGYHQTSVAELVDGLGVGKGVFYWYFDSKDELLLAILREADHDLRAAQMEAIGQHDNPVDRLGAALRASLRWWGDHRSLYAVIQFARTEATFSEHVRRSQRTMLDDTQRLICDIIAAGATPTGAPVLLAQAVFGVASTLAQTQIIGRDRPSDEVADEVIDFCLHGLLGSPHR